MIYFKINRSVFNEDNLKELFKNYPFSKAKAIYRTIKRQCDTILKDYPEIDIVVNYKRSQIVLGRFYLHRIYKGAEYKFLGDKQNPCIVLFWDKINNCYSKHNIKGIKKVLYHEYGHFKQWLLTGHCQHNVKIQSKAKKYSLDSQLRDCKEYLNITN